MSKVYHHYGQTQYASRAVQFHPHGGSIRFRLALRTYAPWGVRVVSQTKSRKIPTRKNLPLFFASRYQSCHWMLHGRFICDNFKGAANKPGDPMRVLGAKGCRTVAQCDCEQSAQASEAQHVFWPVKKKKHLERQTKTPAGR